MEQLSDLLNMSVDVSMGKREFSDNLIVIMLILRFCSPFSFNY